MGNFMNSVLRFLAIAVITFVTVGSSFANEVNLYTSRHYDSDDALYQKFTNDTGIKVNVISGKGKALMERLASEGVNSPADVFITVDAGNLWKVQKDGMFQSISSDTINSIVPENLRGPNNEWVGIAKRSRVIYYNPVNVSAEDMEGLTYEDLSDPKWKGRVAIRSSGNMYNQSLVASLIANNGIDATEKWAHKFVGNFARKPEGNDRAQIMAVANGEADVAVANSYYIGLMLSGKKGEEQQAAARKVELHFPGQDGRGAHINVSGAGLMKNAPNANNAVKFIEFLLSEEAQSHIVNNTYEFPMLEGVAPSDLIAQFGSGFKEDQTSVASYGEFNPEAVKLMDRVGWQ
jgi:iron(III) transport system substrate-binding protein